jgi:mannose/fructose/N-acetylgalactosamine-specific phosphotransferase system component IIC
MQQPKGIMAHWPSGLEQPIVAGTMIGLVMVPEVF